jgi:excisionase family DNA binding protein
MEQLLTIKEAAKLLACTEGGIRKWIGQRRLPSVRIGRLRRLRLSDLQRFVGQDGR